MKIFFGGILLRLLIFNLICEVIKTQVTTVINDEASTKNHEVKTMNFNPLKPTKIAMKAIKHLDLGVKNKTLVKKALNAPYQAHIKFDTYKGSILMCCAAIIGPRILLTSAYCFDPRRYAINASYPRDKILEVARAVAGVASSEYQDMGQWRKVVDYIEKAHAREANFIVNDIAILFIDSTWNFNDVVKMIPILTQDENFIKRECAISTLKIVGDIESPYPNTLLQETRRTNIQVGKKNVLSKINFLSPEACEIDFEKRGYKADSSQMLCVLPAENETIYWEYGGGPLICNYPEYESAAELGLLVGILSQEAERRRSSSFFTKIAEHADWINKILVNSSLNRDNNTEENRYVIQLKRRSSNVNYSDRITSYILNVFVLNVFLHIFSCTYL